MAVRYTGRLKKWNAERGFGFIVPDEGGAELFVHVTAFARTGSPPAVGDVLSFEVELDREGKKRAVRALRSGEQAAGQSAYQPARAARPRPHTMSRAPKRAESGLFGRLVTGAFVCALIWFAYSTYANRVAKYEASQPAPSTLLSPIQASTSTSTSAIALPGKLPLPAGFSCDGRSMCSQMTSCQEATLFIQNCPGTQMDGNGDGVPCEQQWCTR